MDNGKNRFAVEREREKKQTCSTSRTTSRAFREARQQLNRACLQKRQGRQAGVGCVDQRKYNLASWRKLARTHACFIAECAGARLLCIYYYYYLLLLLLFFQKKTMTLFYLKKLKDLFIIKKFFLYFILRQKKKEQTYFYCFLLC
jgi:hypothetical protein